MRTFFKLAIAALAMAVGVLGAVNSVVAAEVAKGDNGTLSIGGVVFSRFGMLTPGGAYGQSPDSPAALTAYGEGILDVTGTNKDGDLSAVIELRVRTGGGQLGPPNAGSHYITGAETVWRPIQNLRVDVGLIPSRNWEERPTQWDNYTGFRPIPQGDDYDWFPENKRAADITYEMPGDMKIEFGVWLPVDPPTWNSDGPNNTSAEWFGDGNAGTGTPVVTSSIVPHLLITGSNFMFSALFGTENLERTGDNWKNSEKSANTGFVVVGRFNYMEQSFVKAGVVSTTDDKFNAFGAPADQTAMTISASVQQSVGVPYSVYLEFMTAKNESGIKDNERQWMAIGFKKSFAGGGRVQVFYESNDAKSAAANPDPDTFIGIGFAQPF